MVRSQKVGCAILAGVLILEAFLGAACTKKEKKDSSSTSQETMESESEDPSSISSEETSSEIQQQPVDPVEQEAKALAAELGVDEEELHGRYELFIKYADCVVNNPKMGEWRGYALHYFPIVADHLGAENEAFFLEKVRNLRMISMPIQDAGGDFNAPGDVIRVYSNDGVVYNTDATRTTVYHEMTHFLDAFNDGDECPDVFYTGDRFAYEADFTTEELERSYEITSTNYYTNFITEGGAELYMSKYFGRSPRAYYAESCFLTGLEWIYGSEALDHLFFGRDSSMQFIQLLKDAGYSDQEICKVIKSFNYDTYARIDQPDEFICFEEVLVDLYEHVKGKNWKEDKVFCRILQQIHIGYSNMYDPPFQKRPEISEVLMASRDRFQWSDDIMAQLSDKPDTYFIDQMCVMIRNDKPYLATRLQVTDGSSDPDMSAVEVEYDFDQEKVLSHKYFINSYPQPVPKPLPSGKALDDRLASFVHDNSAAHRQTAYSEDPDMKDLYERAAEMGNKYGVYIHVGKDLPEYLERGDVSSRESLKTALDHVEKVLSQFPDGYFDQLNYGYFSRFEIVLCDWPIQDEMAVYKLEDGYVFHIALECRNQKNLDQVEARLLDAVFTATDMKLKNYFENFEDPDFSEEVWMTYNPDFFNYAGYLDEEKADELWKENKDYFVSGSALRFGQKDRSQLMTAVLQSKDLPDGCLKKAEYYSRMIREAFDDSTWPEKTTWEEELAKQMEESGQKAA